MAGLRESKKAATRIAIAEAAAQVILDSGAEALTVATVAARANVATRTFHNYFSGVDEALLTFVESELVDVARQMRDADENQTLSEVFEEIIVAGITDSGVSLHSMNAFFSVIDVLHTVLEPTKQLEKSEEFAIPLYQACQSREPDLSRFHIDVLLNASAAAATSAMREYLALPEPRVAAQGQQLVRDAFRILRAMH